MNAGGCSTPASGAVDFQRLKQLFLEALELDSPARAAMLSALRPDDPALAEELELMLTSEPQPGCRLENLSWVAALEGSHDLTGQRIGAFVLVSELGRGGTGVVYLARREDGALRQLAALKVLAGGQSARSRERFHFERQLLAELRHPNIARMYDAGEFEGRPWYVLEYIDGLPITAWANARKLGLRRRISLFLQVLAALDHAHGQLVVHRDLKPSNVLVGKDGVVKLLDFGIAKTLDEAPGQAALTRLGERVYTPQYAAPEQIRGGNCGVATDVYQLGILLCELLSGELPIAVEGLDPFAREQAVIEHSPRSPSQLLRAGGEAATATLKALRVPLARACARLRGDLDSIVLQCLRKEPALRYASVAALRADLLAWSRGFPVAARKGQRIYALAKFGRRHWLSLGIGVLLVLAAVAEVWWSRHQLNVLEQQLAELAATDEALLQQAVRELAAAGRCQRGSAVQLPPRLEAALKAACAKSDARNK